MQIYHNPRCSKSRQTLALIEQAGVNADIVLYLENPPSPDELRTLLDKLGIPAHDLLRKNEPEYKSLGLDNPAATDAEIILAMSENPGLIERPVVVSGKRAIIGRPPENVKDLL